MPPDALDFSIVRRVLVIKLRHHGDVLLASPVFSVLKSQFPHLEVDALVYADTAEMLMDHPAITHLFTINRQWKELGAVSRLLREWQLLQQLRSRQYDLVVHLTDHPRGAWIKRLVGATWGVARDLAQPRKFWRNSFSHLFKVPRGRPRHTVEMHLDALRRLGVYPTCLQKALVLEPGVAARQRISQWLPENNLRPKQFIHIHPASRWLFKCWPAPAMAELIQRLQLQGWSIVLTGAPDPAERKLLDNIQALLSKPAINIVGQLNLRELAALSQQARLFIGMDSAPMHIAAAVGTPTVALFGPSGDQEWRPWLDQSRVVISDRHACRPCGQDGCGGGKRSDCLETLPVEQVYQAVQALLTNQPNP